MSKLQLKKEHWLKKRFVFCELSEVELWYDRAQDFALVLTESSQYQRVTNNIFVKMDLAHQKYFVGFEVIGVYDQAWSHDEFSDIDHLVYELPLESEKKNFAEIQTLALQVIKALGKKISTVVYFQLDDRNLALHFFYQKDYSQVHINNA